MGVGAAIKEALQGKEMKQTSLARATNYSAKTVSAWVTGRRKIPKEVRPILSQEIDDPFVYIEMRREATGGVGFPIYSEKYLDRKNPSALMIEVKRQNEEAFAHLRQACLHKPHLTTEEREDLREALWETFDAITSEINMVASVCLVHNYSMKELHESWYTDRKAKGWFD